MKSTTLIEQGTQTKLRGLEKIFLPSCGISIMAEFSPSIQDPFGVWVCTAFYMQYLL